jgi:phosphoserine aminotransferase
MPRIFNFSAGPAVLPEPVLKEAQAALWDLNGTGIGVAEHSHRGKAFDAVLQETIADCRQLAGIPENYHVLFLQGGASLQFSMVPMNLLPKDRTADYLVTGAWSEKAIKDAKRYGGTHTACSSADQNFNYIPKSATYSANPVYVHFTSNNTIFGTQFRTEPQPPAGVPLICDASSDIFSRPIDVSKYGLIYAGAQKNLGPSGVTLVIIRDDLVQAGCKDLPPMLQYRTHSENDSCYNTPPTFGIYLMGQVFKWLMNLGGLAAIEKQNEAKAKVLYDYLDQSQLFKATAEKESRSRMNIPFVTGNEETDKAFISAATKAGFDGLKGHRSVGGMRASIYNAFPPAGVQALADFMRDFEKKQG